MGSADWHEVRITDIVLNPEKHAVSILKDLDRELDRVAQDYRGTGDFGHLCTQVLDAFRKLWLGLEYWSAIYSAVEAPIPDGLIDDTLWDRYVDDTWGRIFAILQTLPIRNLMVDPDEFDSVVKRLVTVLLASLDTVGKSVACQLGSAAQMTSPHVRTQ